MNAPLLLRQIHLLMFKRDTCPPKECEKHTKEIDALMLQLQLVMKKDMAYIKAGINRLYPEFLRSLREPCLKNEEQVDSP